MRDWGYKTAAECSEILTDGKLSIYEQWAFWAEHIEKVNSWPIDEDTLETLGAIIGEKDYFVYSSSADSFFERAGFDSRRVYTAAGSWEYYQCAKACSSSAVFPAVRAIQHILSNLRDYGVVTGDCLPKCSHCGGDCMPNVRLSDNFCHERYEQRLGSLISWLEGVAASKSRLVILELDTSFKTNRLATFPMESIAADLGGALLRFSTERYPWVPAVLNRAVALPKSSFQDLPELLADSRCSRGQALGSAAEKSLLQTAMARKSQRQERQMSVEPIHWRSCLEKRQ
ncbi:unnamed protein product [Durusdinium trenchii]|uniref:Uncharacterized protein n=2 Tax=Durusdinium trenchii TaxID=1381693 RepID=A0ABP0MRW5_9DINO